MAIWANLVSGAWSPLTGARSPGIPGCLHTKARSWTRDSDPRWKEPGAPPWGGSPGSI